MFRAERAFRQGHSAWLDGDLERAIERLEEASAAAPGAADPLYPLARALAEKGDRDRALAVIERAIAIEPARPAGNLSRAIILHDHGNHPEAREELDRVPPGNPLAAALSAFLDLPGGIAPGTWLTLPPAARWIADASGRLLALLEEAFAARWEEWIAFHHVLYAGDEKPPLASSRRPGKDPRHSARDWRAALDEKFQARAHGEVEAAFADPGVPGEWKDLPAKLLVSFALLASGKHAAALRFLEATARNHPRDGDIHFLSGLCHTAGGRRREAAWSYARAARLIDIEVDEVAKEIFSKLEGGVLWADAAPAWASAASPGAPARE